MKRNTFEILAYVLPFIIALLFSCKGNKENPTYGSDGKSWVTWVKNDTVFTGPAGNYRIALKYPPKIIKLTQDERGLISVTYIPAGETDTVGLDYLTITGFNHMLRGEIDSVYHDAPSK